jgi:uncharacterized protein YbjT (DUF2867 family)
MIQNDKTLVTGATGYIGGRLIPKLLELGYPVRVLARNPDQLGGHPWREKVEVVKGDVLDPLSLSGAMEGIRYAYYLIHSMGSGNNFHQYDIDAAHNFGTQAKTSGVERIIYLGGLGDPEESLSQHLTSRHETGTALRSTGIPVTEFRAAVVVGSGSMSFEMIRYLVERLPTMICPRWVYTKVQPIGITDLLEYLSTALQIPETTNQIIEIGGKDVTTYGDMMLGFAKARGLRRLLIPVPVLTPRLSSYWIHWITPIPSSLSGPLIEGLRNEVIVKTPTARRLFPSIHPMDYISAVTLTLNDLDAGRIDTSWSDALWDSTCLTSTLELEAQSGIILERRRLSIAASPETVYRVFTEIGGARGWYFANWLWQIRGVVDRVIGGVGLRRGRRHPNELRMGDAVDFWRVEHLQPGTSVRFKAEMKLPGKAWLQFTATAQHDNSTVLEQIVGFAPKGLSGLMYWYALYPIHRIIFHGLIRSIKSRAE